MGILDLTDEEYAVMTELTRLWTIARQNDVDFYKGRGEEPPRYPERLERCQVRLSIALGLQDKVAKLGKKEGATLDSLF